MNLYEYLKIYKNITLKLIDTVKQEGKLEELIDERAKIVDKIGDLNFSKEEFKNTLESLNILELDDDLQLVLKSEQTKTKNQIDMLRKTREARKNYSKVQENLSLFTARS